MANMQSRFFSYCKEHLNAVTIMTIDKDETGRFDELYKNTSTDYLIDLRDRESRGIVAPTFCAIDKAADENCDIFTRITQDTQVMNFDRFIRLVQDLSEREEPFLCGRQADYGSMKEHLAQLGMTQEEPGYRYVQGNLITASMDLWKRRYKQLPRSVRHYCDDSVFTYMVEHLDNIKPTFIKWDFWQEYRTRNIYFLEALYNNRQEYAARR